MSTPSIEYILNSLNPTQREAAMCTEGPLLVVAGAGSGKTRVLTCRIAYLMSKGVAPYRILSITFTNKAAAEMRERVESMVGHAAKDVWLSTFHAFCARFLRMEIDQLGGYNSHFTIYDSGDSLALIKTCLKELNLDDKTYQPYSVQASISNAKNALIDAKEFSRQADTFHARKLAEVYSLYVQKLRNNNALDFDDLLLISVRLLQNNDEVRAKYQEKFQYVLVDEYQDTNRPQYLLAKILSEKHRNLCVVGDADQSIYAWRGADIRNILDFESDYPDAKIVKLEQNYRSTQTILDAANAVIERNTTRKPKSLWTENPEGERIAYYNARDERDEATHIANTINHLNTVWRVPYREMAVLYRTNAQSRAIEEAFMQFALPYVMVGGLKFYERKEIKDIIAYLRVINNPTDTVSLQRIINVPKRGIGDTTVRRLNDYAAAHQLSLFDVISNPDLVPDLTARAKTQLENLAEFIFLKMGKAASMPVADLLNGVITDSGYLAELEQEQDPQADARIENLKELLSVAKKFATADVEDTLDNFLSTVALVSDIDTADTSGESITLMTLHSAKGLEYPHVFMAGMEEGLFPHSRTLMNEVEIEEERRLCYVGITRAQRRLYISNARQRMIFGNTVMYPPSRFLQEIPRALLEDVNQRKTAARPQVNSGTCRPLTMTSAPTRPAPVIASAPSVARTTTTAATGGRTDWRAGDKAMHPKWGVGTVVATKGSGETLEIQIAFPGSGIRNLMAVMAPIQKV
ncbi:ATP-dependent DNA helicase PcrA [Anaerosporomusa subterranea]|uniref:ATP-dependent DNA helicase n=1 Tax=Anaerosporomusa subterranea TaxID=1794912 RepID=A0A154BNS5_ANASB|nr:DNA helicase PcrA [Anaerosporomusa subterranea]KYZ75168.1 ATP-dependent DNA helicase PcrA [Anaerosporomusa subterranea]